MPPETAHELGYLTGKVESISKRLDKHIEGEEKHMREFHEKLDQISSEVSLYKSMIKFFKMLGVATWAIVVFYWREVKGLFK